MASSTPLCEICNLRHTSKPATVWCSECDDALCTDCSEHLHLAKPIRHHIVSPIEDYQKLPEYILNIEQSCKEHDEKFTHFCKQHDTPCCVSCILQYHKQCQDIPKIVDVVQNVKFSHTFQEIEQNLTELAENIQRIRKDQNKNLVAFQNSKIQVEKEIKEFQVKLNNHLEKLQDDIIKDLNRAEETESKKIQKMVDDLGKKEKDINELQDNLSNIKQHASDVQAYLAMKQIQSDVSNTESSVELLVNSSNLQHKTLSLKINAAMKDFLSHALTFGNIVVQEKGCNVITTKKKNQQAQKLVPHQQGTIDDITLHLQQTLNINDTLGFFCRYACNIRGCCILPDGRLVFTAAADDKIIFMNADGTQNTTLTIPSEVYDVVYVKYNNSLAVTSGGDSDDMCITFINITNNKVEDTIKLDSKCYGITEKNNTLFYCSDKSIISLNLIDKTIKKFKEFKQVYGSYIDIYENSLYHTNNDTHKVTCYDLGGEVKWEFKDVNIIRHPHGISVDNRGNVYVASYRSFNVVVISSDGQRCRELFITNKDKIHRPIAIHYDRSTNNLLVANYNDKHAFLYKVT